MSTAIQFRDLMDYTSWERGKWHKFFGEHPEALHLPVGPHGDGRFTTVGDLVKHVFGAEKRYVERLNGQPLSEFAGISSDDAEALFNIGEASRTDLEYLIESLPAAAWEIPHEFKILTHTLTATPRKIVAHVLMHEVRHWAQIATICRLAGNQVEFRDLLFSPVFESKA
jgi:uncharacterized damage-inducible protein DinB